MDENVKASWQRALHPETLKSNIITASIFSMAFEMLKNSIVVKIEDFYSNGFDRNGNIVGPAYKENVLSINRSPVYASLKWLQQMNAIDDDDIACFERIKRHRNTLTHETLKFASEGADFDVQEAFDDMISLLRKIEMWWFENFEMAIDPDAYPQDLDLDQVVPGPVWTLKMLIDVSLGTEGEARQYYDSIFADEKET